MKLIKKTAIITGASDGIGKSIAIALSEQGFSVMLAARNEKKLQKLSNEISASGGTSACCRCDITNESEVKNLVETTVSLFGQIDLIVNNAGIGIYGPLENSSTDDWDTMLNTNARGPYLLSRISIPHLRKQDLSFIINIGSVVSTKGYPEQAIYTASKHALLGMSKSLAKELQPDNIRVHVICPGGVDTEMVSRARPDLDRSILMQPQDIADAVIFLITRRGNAVIDQIDIRRAASTPWA